MSIYKGKQRISAVSVGQSVGQSAGVKLFHSIEEMNKDTNVQEGQLAVVYGQVMTNMKSTDTIQNITFPDTVILPSTITEPIWIRLWPADPFDEADADIYLSDTSFGFNLMTDQFISIQYTSEDGITYTRTSGDQKVEMEVPLRCGYIGEWDDNIGYFIQVEGSEFKGMFKSELTEDLTKLEVLKGSSLKDNLQFEQIDLNIVKVEEILNSGNWTNYYNHAVIYNKETKTGKMIESGMGLGIVQDGDTKFLAVYDSKSRDYKTATIDFSTYVVSDYRNQSSYTPELTEFANISYGGYKLWKWLEIRESDLVFNLATFAGKFTVNYYLKWTIYDGSTNETASDIQSTKYIYKIAYNPAPNQFTLDNQNQLLPDISAYGKTGPIKGDGSIYDKLEKEKLLQQVLNLPCKYRREDGAISIYDNDEYTKYVSDYNKYPAGYFKVSDTTEGIEECYHLGITVDHKTVIDLNNLTGAQYCNAYFGKCSLSNNYMVIAKKVSNNRYYAFSINNLFSEILLEQELGDSISNCNITDIAATFSYTNQGERVSHCCILDGYNNRVQELQSTSDTRYINIRHSTAGFIYSSIMDTSYNWIFSAYNILTGQFQSLQVPSSSSGKFYSYALDTTNHAYLYCIHSGSKTVRIYKYDKTQNSIELNTTYTFTYLFEYSIDSQFQYISGNCYEDDSIIMDFSNGIAMTLKPGVSNYLTLDASAIIPTEEKDESSNIIKCSNNFGAKMIKHKWYLVNIPDDVTVSGISITDASVSFSLNGASIVDLVPTDFGMKIFKNYNISTNSYEYDFDELDYTGEMKIVTDSLLSVSGYLSYYEFKRKWLIPSTPDDCDIMILRTNFVKENDAFGTYVKAYPQHNYENVTDIDKALNLAKQIKGILPNPEVQEINNIVD